MLDMRIQNSHLAATDTRTNIRHTIIVTDSRMLIIRIRITSLRSIPHNLIGILRIAANESAATGSRNHLIAVERQHAVLAESSEHLTVETRTHTLSGILDHRNPILLRNRHNLVNVIRHTIKRHRHNSLRITPCLLLPVNDSLLQQYRIHIPSLRL